MLLTLYYAVGTEKMETLLALGYLKMIRTCKENPAVNSKEQIKCYCELFILLSPTYS